MALPKLTDAQKKAHLDKIVPLYQKYKAKVKTPILLSILIAQNIHESYFGTSDLYTKYNNVAGMKYKDTWTGRKINYASGEEIDGKWVEGVKSDFIWFDSIEQSIEYHANFCQNTDWRRKTYEKALSSTTYVGQAAGLTGTYATDSKYGAKLIGIIEKYDLTKYDKEETDMSVKFPKPKMVDRRSRALGFPGRGVYARRPLSAITTIVEHYTATSHEGYGETVIKAHEDFWSTEHGWDIGGYPIFIDRSGNIFWNYDLEICTYGASAANPYTVHVSCEAKLVNGKPNYTAAQIKSRAAVTLWLMEYLNIPATRILGHLEVPGNSTNCPGYNKDELNAMRADFAKMYKAGTGTPIESKQPVIVASKTDTYTVKHGDNLWAVATAHGLTLNQIRELNQLKSDMLMTGQKLKIKGSVPPVVTPDPESGKEVGVAKPKEYPGKGTFAFNTAVNVRNSPRLDNTPVALYNSGESVNYDRILYGASYTWLSYISYGGTRRYVACGDNGGLYGEFVK